MEKPDKHTISGSHLPFFDQLYDEIYNRDDYQLDRLQRTLRPAVIWDIGANLGLFAMAASACWPDAITHCWEPNPKMLAHIPNNAPSAVVHAAAASHMSGPADFIAMDWACCSCMTSAFGDAIDADPDADTIEVNCEVPWETAPAPDLMKVDCEGGEYSLLGHLPVRPSVILVELHGPKARQAIATAVSLRPEYNWRVIVPHQPLVQLLQGDLKK